MKKIIIFIIVLCCLCFIETAGSETCSNCEIQISFYNIFYGTEHYSYCTNERSRTHQATYEALNNWYILTTPQCSDDCCYDENDPPWTSVCTDGNIYYGPYGDSGDWDVICYDTDTDT